MFKKTRSKLLLVTAVVVAGLLAWAILAQAAPRKADGSAAIRGAGTSLVRAGTGAPSFTPVMTKLI